MFPHSLKMERKIDEKKEKKRNVKWDQNYIELNEGIETVLEYVKLSNK